METEIKQTTLEEFAISVAKLLGPNENSWVFEAPNKVDYPNEIVRWGELIGPNGMKINLHKNDRMVSISGGWPKSKYGGSEFSNYKYEERPKINVSLDKATHLVAKDITRRFLSVYIPEFEKQDQRRIRSEESYLNKLNIREKIISTLGKIASFSQENNFGLDSKINVRFYCDDENSVYGEFDIYSNGINLDITNISVEKAIKIAKILAENKNSQ